MIEETMKNKEVKNQAKLKEKEEDIKAQVLYK